MHTQTQALAAPGAAFMPSEVSATHTHTHTHMQA